MKAKHDALVEALTGMFDAHHGELAQMELDQIAFLDQKIAQLQARIRDSLAARSPKRRAWTPTAPPAPPPAPARTPGAARRRPAGGDPRHQPGPGPAIIAETGLDMTRFPTAAHLVSWAGLCPAANQSGPRTGHGKKEHGNAYLRGALGQAALGAARTGTFLGERYRRVARRRGKAKAQVAVARSILIIISLGHLAGGDWIRVGEIKSVAASTGLGNYCDASD